MVGKSESTGYEVHALRTAPNSPINPATDNLGTLGGSSSAASGINSLSQIAVLTEVIRRAGPDERVTAPLTTVANLSRDLLDSMNDIVWAINPKRDSLADLTSRMRRFAADTLTAHGIDLCFAAPEGQDDTRLGGDLRREIFLILKESVNNIVRHSRCSQAAVQFLMQREYVRLTVSDNGKGFDPARPDQGNGLANMRLRAARLGGTLDIATGNGLGVTVTLTVPLARGRRMILPHIFM